MDYISQQIKNKIIQSVSREICQLYDWETINMASMVIDLYNEPLSCEMVNSLGDNWTY